MYLINTHNGIKEKGLEPINIDIYPAVKKHLDSYLSQLQKRQDKGDTIYNLRNCAYTEDFSKQKIIYPNMTKFMPFVFDDKGLLTNQKCFIITGKNIAYLTAFLNSSLFKFCYKENFPELQGGTRELSKVYFDKIFVKEIDEIIENKILNMINKIQDLKQNNVDSVLYEKELDEMIFDIHNLTDEEKKQIGFIEIK